MMAVATVDSGLIPDTLYKYRSFEDKHGLDLLEHQVAWFGSARAFNDPFDCAYTLRYDMMTREEMISRAYDSSKGIDPVRSRQDAAEAVDLLQNNKPLLRRKTKMMQEAILETYGVFSLSSRRNSVLMWSHYGNSHSGFCVGLDTEAIERRLRQLSEVDRVAIMPVEVSYVKDYPVLVPTSEFDDPNDAWKALLATKSEDWSYEQEFRYIAIGSANQSFYLSKECFSEVILGVRTSTKHEALIRSNLIEYNGAVKLYKTKTKPDSFELEFEQIDY